MITPASIVRPTERLHRYSDQMLQAKLKNPGSPVRTYRLQALFEKQQVWTSETARTLSTLYESARELMKAAEQFERVDPDSFIDRRGGSEQQRTDHENIIRQTADLVDSFNRFNQFVREYGDDLANDLQGSVKRVLQNSEDQLEALGLRKAADGSLTLDEEQLNRGIADNFAAVRRGLSHSFGFVGGLYRVTQQLQETPLASYTVSPGQDQATALYRQSLLPSLFFAEAAHTGLYFNQLF